MQWTYFLDVLGYGAEQKKIDTQEKADNFMEFMKVNKSFIEFQDGMNKDFYSDKEINIYDLYEIKSVFISDSFVLTAIPKDKEFEDDEYYHLSSSIVMELTFQILYFIENILDEKELTIRGGISKKFTDIDTESSLAVGQGLIEAYKLESKDATVPRILLSQDISDDKKLMSYFEKHSKMYGENFSIFSKDTDNFYYLNYLGFMLAILRRSENPNNKRNSFPKEIAEFISKNNIDLNGETKNRTIKTLENFKKVIQKNLKEQSSNDNPDIYNKYVWLKKYHNSTIEDFQDLEFIQKYKI